MFNEDELKKMLDGMGRSEKESVAEMLMMLAEHVIEEKEAELKSEVEQEAYELGKRIAEIEIMTKYYRGELDWMN